MRDVHRTYSGHPVTVVTSLQFQLFVWLCIHRVLFWDTIMITVFFFFFLGLKIQTFYMFL